MKLTAYIRNLLLAIPFVILTIVPFVLLADLLNISIHLHLAALGATGWWLAMLLRIPVVLLTKNMSKDKGQNIIISASGPAEEVLRLVVLLLVGLTVDNGYSIGLGWAAIEIAYAILQGFGMGIVQQKTDRKAQEAKAMLQSMGMNRAMEPSAPFWGIVERLSANGLHISLSLLLVVSPYLLLLTAPLHSFMNFLIVTLMKRSMALAQITLFIICITFFVISVFLARPMG